MKITAWTINLIFWYIVITKLTFDDGSIEWQWEIERKKD